MMKMYVYADAQNSNAGGSLTEKIYPESIAVVKEDVIKELESIDYYEEVSPNGTSNTIFTNQVMTVSQLLPDLEVGYHKSAYGTWNNELYVTLDLAKLPKENDWDLHRQITSVEIQAMVNPDYYNFTTPKTVLTVSSCHDMSWYHSDNSSYSYAEDWRPITSKSCYATAVAQDSVIVNSNDLPHIYTWDVTESVLNALHDGDSNITFLLFGSGCFDKVPCLGQSKTDDLVQFSSYSVSSSSFGLGRNLSPLFIVVHTETPTLLGNLLEPSNTLAAISVVSPFVVSAVAWFYRKEITKRLRKKQV